MLNSGLGLCIELERKGDYALFARCESVDGDVVVKDCLTPYIVAFGVGKHEWAAGHYFVTFQDAVDYLNNPKL